MKKTDCPRCGKTGPSDALKKHMDSCRADPLERRIRRDLEAREEDPSVVGYEVIEFLGKGDPMFGGAADDRPLGKSGEFLRGSYNQTQVAKFATREQAKSAADRATKRPGSKVGVIPIRDYSGNRGSGEVRALQNLTEARDQAEAEAIFAAEKLQSGFLGGRLLPPGKDPKWKVQTFYVDDTNPDDILPDGLRRVIVPQFLRLKIGMSE